MKALRLLALILALSFCAVFPSFSASALDDPEIAGRQALCINLETGKILYEKNADESIAPASFTKMMTAILAIEYKQTATPEPVLVSKRVLSMAGANKYFHDGETISYDDLLAALIIANANDAAYLLAETVSGNTAAFVSEMNRKAVEIGMKNTHFTNPAGTDESGMTTTLNDIALLARYAYNNPEFKALSSAESYTIPPTPFKKKGYTLSNNNKLVVNNPLIGYYVKGAIGLNAGGTEKAGYCCASILPYNGLTTLALVSGSTYVAPSYMHFKDVAALLNYGKSGFSEITVIKEGEIIGELPVSQGKDVDHVIAVLDRNISALLPTDLDLKQDLTYTVDFTEKSLVAPVKQGAVLGTYTVSYNGEALGTAQLVAQSAVNRHFWLYLLALLKAFVTTPWVAAILILGGIAVLVLIVLLLIFYLFGDKITAYRKMKRLKKSQAALPKKEAEESEEKKEQTPSNDTTSPKPLPQKTKKAGKKPVKLPKNPAATPQSPPKKKPKRKPSAPVSDLLGGSRGKKE